MPGTNMAQELFEQISTFNIKKARTSQLGDVLLASRRLYTLIAENNNKNDLILFQEKIMPKVNAAVKGIVKDFKATFFTDHNKKHQPDLYICADQLHKNISRAYQELSTNKAENHNQMLDLIQAYDAATAAYAQSLGNVTKAEKKDYSNRYKVNCRGQIDLGHFNKKISSVRSHDKRAGRVIAGVFMALIGAVLVASAVTVALATCGAASAPAFLAIAAGSKLIATGVGAAIGVAAGVGIAASCYGMFKMHQGAKGELGIAADHFIDSVHSNAEPFRSQLRNSASFK